MRCGDLCTGRYLISSPSTSSRGLQTACSNRFWRQRLHNDRCNLLTPSRLGGAALQLRIEQNARLMNLFLVNSPSTLHELEAQRPGVKTTIRVFISGHMSLVASVQKLAYLDSLLLMKRRGICS